VSQERVLRTLLSLGLTEMDAKVYIFLAKKGMQKALEISRTLKMNKEQLYRSLKKLQSRGLVTATLEHPARFSAIPIEKVLDLFIKAKMEEAQEIQRDRNEILSIFNSMSLVENDEAARFTVLEGRNIIYSRIQQMMRETKNRLSTISSVSGLMQAYQFGLFDSSGYPSKAKIKFRFLTELSKENLCAAKTILKEMTKAKLNFEGRNPDRGLRLFPRMVIRDQEEVMFFISPNTGNVANEKENSCLWTNSKALTQAFTAIFEDLWDNAVEIKQKILEIETGELSPETQIITDAEEAKKKFDEILSLAKREITVMTSSDGLVQLAEKLPQVQEWTRKGVSLRLMAPITKENFKAAKQLSKACSVKHVSFSYFPTTIVDGKHVFQGLTHQSEKGRSAAGTPSENNFYTNNAEQVKRIEIMLNTIWENASSPSYAINSPLELSTSAVTPPGAINEFVTKMKNASPDSLPKGYVTCGLAVIHPPRHLDIPAVVIRIFKYDNKSTFGEGNTMDVRLRLKTKKGYTLVPVAAVNTNPKAVIPERAIMAGSPASKNYHLVKSEQLQVRREGNTIFGGWTFQIPLPPTRQSLSPAALLIEGFGEPRHSVTVSSTPSGYRIISECDVLDAFVTFIDPRWKYAGPGSHGQIGFNSTMMVVAPATKETRTP
jgi:sugar-specific transcriptional regulator TrmB